MKNKPKLVEPRFPTELIEIDHELMCCLVSALTLIRLKGKKIQKRSSYHTEPLEIWPGVAVVEKRAK